MTRPDPVLRGSILGVVVLATVLPCAVATADEAGSAAAAGTSGRAFLAAAVGDSLGNAVREGVLARELPEDWVLDAVGVTAREIRLSLRHRSGRAVSIRMRQAGSEVTRVGDWFAWDVEAVGDDAIRPRGAKFDGLARAVDGLFEDSPWSRPTDGGWRQFAKALVQGGLSSAWTLWTGWIVGLGLGILTLWAALLAVIRSR